jgi:hypothetical protein
MCKCTEAQQSRCHLANPLACYILEVLLSLTIISVAAQGGGDQIRTNVVALRWDIGLLDLLCRYNSQYGRDHGECLETHVCMFERGRLRVGVLV